MWKPWSPVVAVGLGAVAWIAGSAIVDWVVLQIYPLPPGLWETASMREIIASRPDVAVVLNIAGDTLILAAVAFFASRWTMRPRQTKVGSMASRAGVWLTVVLGIFVVVNAVVTSNFRPIHAIGLPLFLLAGVIAAKRGATA